MAKRAAAGILVINTGSSSLKFNLFTERLTSIISAEFSFGGGPQHKLPEKYRASVSTANPTQCIESTIRMAREEDIEICATGHRVVHGGSNFSSPHIVTQESLAQLEQLHHLAPLHNPFNLAGIKAAFRQLSCPHVAVFDTAFHRTIPQRNHVYPIPKRFYEEDGIRKYGFHGISVKCAVKRSCELLGKQPERTNVIVAHLGSGCSVTAVKGGQSLDTSMGFTPLEGLMMATRAGDLDPGVIRHILSHTDPDRAFHILNQECGLYAVSGYKDFLRIEQNLDKDRNCRLAWEMFASRICKYIASYFVELEGKVDALVYTGGIGENSPMLRADIAAKLSCLGFNVNEIINEDTKMRRRNAATDISDQKHGKLRTLVVPAAEERTIAEAAVRLVNRKQREN